MGCFLVWILVGPILVFPETAGSSVPTEEAILEGLRVGKVTMLFLPLLLPCYHHER